MVEILTSPYFDQDVIPMVEASIVSIDDELSHDTLIAQPLPEPISPTSTTASFSSRSERFEEPSPPRQQIEATGHHQRYTQQHEPAVESSSSSSFLSSSSSESQREGDYEKQRRVGAGVASAVFGLFVGGPFGAIILGLVTLSYTKKEGAAGDVARGLGDVALVARDKAKEIDDKHHIVDKSKDAAAEAMDRIKKTQQNKELKRKSKRFFRKCYGKVADYAKRHRLVERGSEQLRVLVDVLAENLKKTLENRDRVAAEATVY